MKTTFSGKKITGMLGILPEKESFFDEEVENYSFPEKQTMRLKKVMGYEKHRISKESTAISDLAVAGMNFLLEKEYLQREDIGALVVVSLCPDYFVPHVSNIIQAQCDISKEVLCIDIAQGCCGFLLGLFESCMLLEHLKNKKVVLVNADILSHKVSKRDRNDYPLIGDAAAITIVENDETASEIYYFMYMDGSRGDALKIPAGAFRMPNNAETAIMKDQGDGNFRSLDNMHMDGSAVFNFVQVEVPKLIEELLEDTGSIIEDYDYFLFHQPNKFMLQKLADKVGIPYEKMPMNVVENYGNPSGASIPLATIHNLKDELRNNQYHCCLSAFGSGLAWGAMTLDIGNLDFCEMITTEY